MKRKRVLIPYISNEAREIDIKEKAEVERKLVRFPKELGEEHPFSFKECEKLCLKYGLIKAVIDRHLDFMISPGFTVTSDVRKAEVLINKFIRDSGFDQTVRKWIFEALVKGNGFLELAVNKNTIDVKPINANYMYVDRTKKGDIIGYNQYVGAYDKFNPKKIIPFNPDEIAHLKISEIGDEAYGYGLIYPAMYSMNNLLDSEKQMHTLMKRKANSPYVANVGSIEEPATQDDVTAVGEKFEYLNNMHEWAFDHRVDLKVLDFGSLSEKFATVLEHDKETVYMCFQVPPVIMGLANVPEGLANVQIDTFERRIQSLQASAEKITEEKVFRVLLNANGIDAHVEMEWGLPSEEETNQRVQQLTILLSNMLLSPQLRAMVERDLATKLGYNEEDINLLNKPEQAEEIEREEEENIEQPEIPGEKPSAREMQEMIIKDYNLKEWLNFDYEEYKTEVLKFIETDEFKNLAAQSDLDIELGKLTHEQIEKLRGILLRNFENNGTILKIAEDLKALNLKNRKAITDKGNKYIVMTSEQRRIMIARTESTRVAAEGVINNYQNKGVEKVRFLASISDRTCTICESLNGQIFEINESRGVIPIHTMCRCSFIAVKE